MSDSLRFELVSPERLLKDTTAAMVMVPGTDGDFAVLPGHAPMMSTIRPGVVEVYESEDGEAEHLFVKGGLAQVTSSGLTILAEETLIVGDVDAADLAQKLSDAREDVEDASDDIVRARAEKTVEWMEALTEVIS